MPKVRMRGINGGFDLLLGQIKDDQNQYLLLICGEILNSNQAFTNQIYKKQQQINLNYRIYRKVTQYAPDRQRKTTAIQIIVDKIIIERDKITNVKLKC